ncbi:MAG: Flagellar biosynthesis protein, FliO [Holophagaceae bacterium]|nr:Flagellar biosynthesis protein, FliO [Holophagaceae bacterium]
MVRRALICFGMLLGMGLWAEAPTPPPSPAQQELQQKFTLDDGKPTQGQSAPPSQPSGWRAIGSTVFVLALMGGGLWAFRKWGVRHIPGTGGTRLKLEETLALGDRRHVSILRADDEHFLIAMTPQGVSLLARLDGVNTAATFDQAMDRDLSMEAPMPIREMEARLKGEGR